MKCASIQYGFRVNVQNVKIMHKQEVVGIANFIREQLEEKVFDMIIEDLFESKLIKETDEDALTLATVIRNQVFNETEQKK